MRQKGFPAALINQEIANNEIDGYQVAKEARFRKFSDALPTGLKEKSK
ncbi:hypothetical protein [Serratia liquefaciens]